MTVPPPSLGILLSGAGSTYANLAESCRRGDLRATIRLVVASRPDAGGIALAKRFGHPVVVERDPAALEGLLSHHGVVWVAMCGWLRYWDPPGTYQGRTVNIHPSLLPAFGGKGMYGLRVHEAVLAAGCRVSGCTVHEVAGAYDRGRVIDQQAVPVLPDDTPESLQVRVQVAERVLYPKVLARLLEADQGPATHSLAPVRS